MAKAKSELNKLNGKELWNKYCDFIDISLEEFTRRQTKLLANQLKMLEGNPLMQHITGGKNPKTLEEFREAVPYTSYADYESFLSGQNEASLAVKPLLWCHSAARGGTFKWIPYTREFVDKAIDRMLGGIMLASAARRGETSIGPGFRFLSILPPAPYSSGAVFQHFPGRFPFRPIPPLEASETAEFQERIQQGFSLAMREGVDVIGAIASVMVKMGEAMSGQAGSRRKMSAAMLHPKVIWRLARAFIRAKREGRGLLPKDIWPAKAIMAGGVDSVIYRDEITRYWGSPPFQFYGCTEAYLLAVQSWENEGLVFFPDMVYLEFIPHDRESQTGDDPAQLPPPVLMHELEAGKTYEMVITQCYGMPLMRCRTRDLVKVTALDGGSNGVALPHFTFQRRLDDVIILGSMAWIDEATLWQAIRSTGIAVADWTARKEFDNNQSYLQIYLEPKGEVDAETAARQIDAELKKADPDYCDVENYLGYSPVRVSLIKPGAFASYIEEKRRQGADLAHMKPAHLNAPEAALKHLLEL